MELAKQCQKIKQTNNTAKTGVAGGPRTCIHEQVNTTNAQENDKKKVETIKSAGVRKVAKRGNDIKIAGEQQKRTGRQNKQHNTQPQYPQARSKKQADGNSSKLGGTGNFYPRKSVTTKQCTIGISKTVCLTNTKAKSTGEKPNT